MTASRKWTIAIVTLLGINVIAMVILAILATNGDTKVLPEYEKILESKDTSR
jgi:hypothetical protein